MRRLEIIVVGGGIAGMAYAARLMEAAPGRARIRVLSKSTVKGSSSYAAQGGIAAAIGPDDSFEQHVEDTLRVGAGRNDRVVVEQVVRAGPGIIKELRDWGARFAVDAEDRPKLSREGGHGVARVVHHSDRTGAEVVRVLRERLRMRDGIEIIEDQRVLDLILADGPGGPHCTGVHAIDLRTGDLVAHRADAVVLATGGVGQVFEHTTNPAEATGDGIAMAVRAGVPLRDMAFVQFHPTALFTSSQGQVPLISEAVRGAGARLMRHDRIPLMQGIHPAGDLAPRNVVARTVHAEMRRSGMPYALLDASPIGGVRFAQAFPAITRDCLKAGYRPGLDPLPVMPAAHYLCGGIRTDDHGRTAMPGLFALGECAGTGLHGADRLASNSLLEALVMPKLAAEASLALTHRPDSGTTLVEVSGKLTRCEPATAIRALAAVRHALSTHVGIVRHHAGLESALRLIARSERSVPAMWSRKRWSMALIDLRDMAAVARALTESALAESVSVGTHYLEE
jgi:L-aspartate oxidase